jgi:hypothetical protein
VPPTPKNATDPELDSEKPSPLRAVVKIVRGQVGMKSIRSHLLTDFFGDHFISACPAATG